MSGQAPKRLFLLALCGFFVLLFSGLGLWQVERLQWKRALIARVDARLAATPVSLPPRSGWPRLAGRESEYLKLVATGTFDHGRETLVEALTERGPGYWVLTPLQTQQGTILVNRGFVPPDRRWPERRSAGQRAGQVRVQGLVRPSEPGGRFLRANQPQAERWFSRDVAAIAGRRDLVAVAPFFIDADAAPNPGGYPLGGMTVVRFPNNHLVYALTWVGLAALSLFGLVLTLKSPHKRS